MNNNNLGFVNVVGAGVDINSSNQVTATHLAAARPTNQGGSGTMSALTGIVRGGHRFTASEISADAMTSSSNSDDAPFDFGSVTSSVTFSANALQIITSAERSLNAKFNGKFFVLILP